MAKFTVTEHRRMVYDANGQVTPVFGKPLVKQTGLTFPDGTSRLIAAVSNDTKFVRICADVPLHISYGATADTNDDWWPATSEIIYPVEAGNQLSYLIG